MRALAAAILLLLSACSQAPATPTAVASASRAAASSASAQAAPACKLPVWWQVGNDIHGAFVSVPGGAVTDAGTVPALPNVYGASFVASTNRWVGVDRSMLSPDGTRYAYWKGTPQTNEVHVVDIATGIDRTLYSGPTLYIVIAFESDAIYLVHGVQPRQGAFEHLFRLDPAGGPITLVAGSDRHMYQWGWVMIGDGAAWGIDYRSVGGAYIYSLLRLDLTTGQATSWFESPPDELVWPLVTDLQHRLYVEGVNVGQGVAQTDLWRVGAAGDAPVQLANPGPVNLADNIGSPSAFVADSQGVWLSGADGVWLYGDSGNPTQFAAALPGAIPAGPCS